MALPYFAKTQNSLYNSRHSSAYTYYYSISADIAWRYFHSEMKEFRETDLNRLFDSCLTDRNEDIRLRPGNYIKACIREGKLQAELITVSDVRVKQLINQRDLLIYIHDLKGNPVDGAEVQIGKKKCPVDPKTHVYRFEKYRKKGWIRISYQGSLFCLIARSNEEKNNYYRKSGRKKNYNSGNFNQPDNEYSGFLVLNKPKFKPKDTVFYKAFVTRKKRGPVDRRVLLRLAKNYGDEDTILSVIKPYRKGGYEGYFILSDSLGLRLDQQYVLTLEELKSRKYDPNKYYGKLDDYEYAAKRKVLARGRFDLEEYELKSISFNARLAKEIHSKGEEQSVIMKAVDENDLPVPDGRVRLTVTPNNYGNIRFVANKVFIPDTLWQWEQTLDPVGETRIVLPDSIFPAATFRYNIRAEFLNSNNEQQLATLSGMIEQEDGRLTIEKKEDSLEIKYLVRGIVIDTTVQLIGLSPEDDSIIKRTIRIPATEPIDPLVSQYLVEMDEKEEQLELNGSERPISISSFRSRDSVIISLFNPQKIKVWYNLFKGNKIIERGYGDQFIYQEKAGSKGNYFLSLQYIYAGKAINDERKIPFYEKQIYVNINQPSLIYPGQKVKVVIDVTDDKGNPVRDADVTAYAFTTKFKNTRYQPDVPYLGRYWPDRKQYSVLQLNKPEFVKTEVDYDWERWKKEAGLDSIEYFHFLFPKDIYRYSYYLRDSLTQLAPFVVRHGSIQQVHQLFIDGYPVYFSQTNDRQPYSFPVEPGYHYIDLRTSRFNIVADSVLVLKGQKTIISINADEHNSKISKFSKRADTLTVEEKQFWTDHLIMLNNNFLTRMATIKQNDRIYWLNPQIDGQGLTYYNNYGNYSSNSVLTGPFRSGEVQFSLRGEFGHYFVPEGGYFFSIHPELIKQKELKRPFFSYKMIDGTRQQSLTDSALTEKQLDIIWEKILESRNLGENNLYTNYTKTPQSGQLRIEMQYRKGLPAIRNIFLFRYDTPDFLKVYSGTRRDLNHQKQGLYRLMILFSKNDYLLVDSLEVKPSGINYRLIETSRIQKADSVSIKIWKNIIEMLTDPWRRRDIPLLNIQQEFNGKYLDSAIFTQVVSGRVISVSGNAIMGATALVKGTRTGVVTDANGDFSLPVTPSSTIQISALGYEPAEISAPFIGPYTLVLKDQAKYLNEVVVTAYGVQRRAKELGYANTTINGMLAGRAAGITITSSSERIVLRGNRSAYLSSTFLVILDGIPVPANTLNKINPNDIASVEILKGDDALTLYGASAVNGVLVVTTIKGLQKKQEAEPMPQGSNTLRNRFRDYAYWEPKLRTNEEGKAIFTVSYPDDITSWKNRVLVMADKRRSGSTESTVRSFLELSAQIALPNFAVEGDMLRPIGKAMNYGRDTQEIKRNFYFNDQLKLSSSIRIKNAWIDTLNTVADNRDSLHFKYIIERRDGYFDGEEKKIPVFKQGTVETKGVFASLYRDTSFVFSLAESKDPLTLRAESSVLPVLYDEAEKIRNYEYLCNEQLASKLIALLLQKKVKELEGQKFRNEKAIKEILDMLMKGRSSTGLWGWWNQNDPVGWISLHVINALLMAEENGYTITLNKLVLKDYLKFQLTEKKRVDEISTLRTIIRLDPRAELKANIDSAEKHLANRSLYDKLRIVELRQLSGTRDPALDTLINDHKSTLFGNIYWGEECYRFFDNSIQNTLLMYRILRKERAVDDRLLERIRSYFLEKRGPGSWRNTYESSLILETLLPDLLTIDPKNRPAELKISGPADITINNYPFETKINSGEKISVQKSGVQPVYFTAYRKYWDHDPDKRTEGFAVSSYFEKNGRKVDSLKGGEEVVLKVEVEVKGDGSYVMVEIPIPAGCSYLQKSHSWANNEVHREYFKNKVSIFCSELKQGHYVFTVSLMPRFSGLYHLNPAKAELMYFPTFYGREGMKLVQIK